MFRVWLVMGVLALSACGSSNQPEIVGAPSGTPTPTAEPVVPSLAPTAPPGPTTSPSPTVVPSATSTPLPSVSPSAVPTSLPTLSPTPLPDEAFVDAGPGQIGNEDEVVTLQGSARAAAGRAIAFVEWSQVDHSGRRARLPANRNQNRISVGLPQVEADQFLTFAFTATDDAGVARQDTVQVRVRDVIDNRLPIAVASAPEVVEGPQNVVLDGCASSDPDGSIVRHAWRDAQQMLLGEDCAVTVSLSQGPVERAFDFELMVMDDRGAEDFGQATVRVRPSANNRPPQITMLRADPPVVRPDEAAVLSVVAMDPDGHPLRFHWQQIAGPFVLLRDADTAQARFAAPEDQPLPFTLRFAVTATDGAATDQAEVSVVVDDARPSATPNLLGCLTHLFQPGCPLAPLGRLTNLGAPQSCLTDPFADNCPFGLLVSLDPGIANCLRSPGALGCATLINNVLTPSFFIEQLNPANSAGSCNPTYFPEAPYPHFWGALHEHTAYSDGTLGTTPEDVFERVRSLGWDFAITTDHSDNLAIPLSLPSEECLSPRFPECILADPNDPLESFFKWQATAAAADRFTEEGFVAMRGFEWTSDRFGHANVLFSRNNLNAKAEPGYLIDMSVFWAWFQYPALLGGGDDGLLVFNHPGREDLFHGGLASIGLGDPAYTFNNFRYVPGADARVVGVEVFGKGDEYDLGGRGGSWFATALDQGWFLAPAGSEDHHGIMWGDSGLPKTVLIARRRTPEDLQEAMRARRMYAVAQNEVDIRLDFDAGDGSPMGSRLVRPAGAGEVLRYRVRRGYGVDAAEPSLVVELMSSARDNAGGYQPLMQSSGAEGQFMVTLTDGREWYFLRVRNANGRVIAVSAPIWLTPGEAPLPVCASP